jgi:hypothetical protein
VIKLNAITMQKNLLVNLAALNPVNCHVAGDSSLVWMSSEVNGLLI